MVHSPSWEVGRGHKLICMKQIEPHTPPPLFPLSPERLRALLGMQN